MSSPSILPSWQCHETFYETIEKTCNKELVNLYESDNSRQIRQSGDVILGLLIAPETVPELRHISAPKISSE